jgi:hypothetical protein
LVKYDYSIFLNEITYCKSIFVFHFIWHLTFQVQSVRDVSDKSDVDCTKSDARMKIRLDLATNSSDSETDSTDSRPITRESGRPTPKAKELSIRPVREEVRRNREEALALKIAREEMKTKEEKQVPEADDKEEGRQPKKRVSIANIS